MHPSHSDYFLDIPSEKETEEGKCRNTKMQECKNTKIQNRNGKFNNLRIFKKYIDKY